MKKIAVVLLNLGGPDAPEAVRPFLFNLFNDKAIIGAPQPIRWLIARLISTRRAPFAREIYAHLGGKSPLLELTQLQARALEEVLAGSRGQGAGSKETEVQEARPAGRASLEHRPMANSGEFAGDNYKTFIAMRYWHPMSRETARAVKEWGADEVILLPLYPQFSTTTTGSSFTEWQRAAGQVGLNVPTARIGCYFAQQDFIKAHVALLAEAYRKAAKHGTPRILFSAHGLPQKVVDAGDPYQWQVEQTAAAIMEKFKAIKGEEPGLKPATTSERRERSMRGAKAEGLSANNDYKVCYQSKVGPLEWLKPSTEDEIARACADGVPIVLLPIAFVSEHSETLVELDIEYRHKAEAAGCVAYERVAALGVQDDFIAGLAVLCRAAQPERTLNHEERRLCPAQFGHCVCREAA